MNHEESTIEDPSERPRLEPFATVFVEIIISEAAIGGWFESGTAPPGKDLERISRRIGDQLKSQFGHAIHPAIWIHALLVCVHFFYVPAADIEDTEEEERRTSVLDAAHSLIQSLKLYHDLYDLYLRIF